VTDLGRPAELPLFPADVGVCSRRYCLYHIVSSPAYAGDAGTVLGNRSAFRRWLRWDPRKENGQRCCCAEILAMSDAG